MKIKKKIFKILYFLNKKYIKNTLKIAFFAKIMCFLLFFIYVFYFIKILLLFEYNQKVHQSSSEFVS